MPSNFGAAVSRKLKSPFQPKRRLSATTGQLVRKLHFDGKGMETEAIVSWLQEAKQNHQYTQLSFEEVHFDDESERITSSGRGSGLTTSIGTTLVEVFQMASRQGRMWERLNLEFCEGSTDLVLTSTLLLECIKQLYLTADDDVEALIRRLGATLRINQSLQSIWLLIPISKVSAQVLGETLAYNDSLRKFSLSGSRWGATEDEDENQTDDDDDDNASAYYSTTGDEDEDGYGMQRERNSQLARISLDIPRALAKGFQYNASLRTIDISCSYLNDAVGAILVEALVGQPALVHLDLSGNRFRNQTVLSLAAVLAHPDCQLAHLNFGEQCESSEEADSNNKKKNKPKSKAIIEEEYDEDEDSDSSEMDWTPLCRALMTNDILETLLLNHNQITDDAIIELVRNLQGNETLQELDLEFNQITTRGLKALTKGLSELPCLKVLKLGGNAFGKEGNRLLAQLEDDDDSVCTIMEQEDDSFFSAKAQSSLTSKGSSGSNSGKKGSKKKGFLLGGLTGISEK